MKPKFVQRWASLRLWRRMSQISFLIFFLYLVFRGHGDHASSAGWQLRSMVNPNVVFLANPLTWILTVFASRTLIEKSIWLMIGFVALAVVFGRVFCGWICPLGTLIDAAGRLLRPANVELILSRETVNEKPRKSPLPPLISHRTKYYLLFFLTVTSLLSVNIVGWFDPLAIAMRASAFFVGPATHWLVGTLGNWGESLAGPGGITRPWRVELERLFFPVTQHYYGQAALHFGIFLLVLGLSRLHRRWWCQYLCPLGAFYSLVGRFAPWRRWIRTSDCTECGVCGNACRMQAVDSRDAATVDPGECIRCMECTESCSRGGVSFSFIAPQDTTAAARTEPHALDLSRRGVLVALSASFAGAAMTRMSPWRRSPAAAFGMDVIEDEWLLRPPGARAEPQFLTMCIRCGECFRVCPQNALHPMLLEGGAEKLWTPRVIPRLGYCDPSCTLCSLVCPTTALAPVTPRRKGKQIRIGGARVDRNRCLAWNDREMCGICEEVCPVTPKAIELRNRGPGSAEHVPAPEVLAGRCIGCGICENKCPVEGQAAIRVHRRGEIRFSKNT